MRIVRFLKPVLLFYECVRIVILAVFVFTSPGDTALSKLIFAAPGALFPLMALFIWLDVSRYKAYLPLFTAGKYISVFSLLGWSIVSGSFTMIGNFTMLLLCGDLLAVAAVVLINRDAHKSLTAENAADVEVS